MTRPLIGITTYVENARFSVHDTKAAVVPWAYVDQVSRAGGRPVLIPPQVDGGVEVLDGLDGLVICGGADVDPARYDEAPHPAVYTDALRDSGELPLVRVAFKTGLPLLGVCRGMQLMTVAAGGRIHQHVPEVVGHDGHRPLGPTKVYAHHPVRFATGSRCRELFGAEAVVNSFHHQAVKDPGRLVPTAWCVTDNLIEAVEHPDHPFAVGVQWHPEDMAAPDLFQALVSASANTHSARTATRTEFFATV
ncbi:gamma-glutamyl-gamma-aminobutyrate hydrolase family protein [Catellatospora tritici]|uniref:gamma-glutamyl-gamma-aminobutyrate hydrolase family protein n=1 Tax=Catellatospora tritici TaxID=2851566 RepID=UPI0027E0DA90|nr:gamma-glutamyl-gamma-aminobutyrate hydrolase family protein [Catellatospora tritici]